MKRFALALGTLGFATFVLAQTRSWGQYESAIPEEDFNRAWDKAKDAAKESRIGKWFAPGTGEFPFKDKLSRGSNPPRRYFSDWQLPTRDLDGLVAKIVIFDVNDKPIGQPQFVTVKGFWDAPSRPKNVGVNIMLAPGGITSSAQVWIVANGQRATTGMFKL